MSGSLLAFFHFCLLSVLFSALSILKLNSVSQKRFPLVSVLFRGFSNPPFKQTTKSFTALQTNIASPGDERVGSAFKLPPHTRYTCSQQRFRSRAYLKIDTPTRTHRHSLSKERNSYSPASTLHPHVAYA